VGDPSLRLKNGFVQDDAILELTPFFALSRRRCCVRLQLLLAGPKGQLNFESVTRPFTTVEERPFQGTLGRTNDLGF
jgi:hypothetical protein